MHILLCCVPITPQEVFVKCGADRLSTPFTWPCLEKIDLSYNSIGQLDDSIVSINQSINQSISQSINLPIN